MKSMLLVCLFGCSYIFEGSAMDIPEFSNLCSTANYLKGVQSGKVADGEIDKKVEVLSEKSATVIGDEAKEMLPKVWLIYAELTAYKPTLSNKCYNIVVSLYKKITKKDASDIDIASLLWEYQKDKKEYNATMLNYILSMYNGQEMMLSAIYHVLIGTVFSSCVPQRYRAPVVCDWKK